MKDLNNTSITSGISWKQNTWAKKTSEKPGYPKFELYPNQMSWICSGIDLLLYDSWCRTIMSTVISNYCQLKKNRRRRLTWESDLRVLFHVSRWIIQNLPTTKTVENAAIQNYRKSV